MMVVVNLLVLVVFVFVASGAGVASPSNKKIIDKKELHLNFQELRKLPLSFLHVKQLKEAIEQNEMKFQVVELVNLSGEQENINNEYHMHCQTTYTLFEHAYHNLDAFKPKQFRSFSSSHIVHCATDLQFETGSIIIGTNNGIWFHEAKVSFHFVILVRTEYITIFLGAFFYLDTGG